jgi:NIMA (never in mitosis gene a)-related kinase
MGENYKRIKVLGEGSFGKCFLAECTNTGEKYAIKEIDIRQMSTAEKDEALKEAKILERLQHPNIIRFHEVYRTKNGKLCIVMDYADGGDLQEKIKSQRGRLFSEREVLDLFVQLCLALKHVHDRKVLHRDIKSQNVFLSGSTRVKLGDFGIARVLRNTCEKARTMVGTPYYLSPEIIENKPYSFKSDVWSLGVMLYELCALKPPFDASSLHFLAMKIVRGNYAPVPPHYSRDLKSLVSQMLTVDPGRRPTINQILRQPFIKERIKQFLSETIHSQEFSHTVLHSQNVFNPAAPVAEVPRREVPPARDAQRPRAFPPKDAPREAPRELPKELPREFQLIEAQRERERLEKERLDVQRELDLNAQRAREAQRERERVEAQRERERIEAQRLEAYKERERLEAQRALEVQRERDRVTAQRERAEAIKERERIDQLRADQARVRAEQARAQARLEQQRAEPRPLADPHPRQPEGRGEPKSGGIGFFVEADKPNKKDKSLKNKYEAEQRRREQEEEDKRRRALDSDKQREERNQQREEERQKMLKDIKKKKKASKHKPVVEWGGRVQAKEEEDKAPYVKELYQEQTPRTEPVQPEARGIPVQSEARGIPVQSEARSVPVQSEAKSVPVQPEVRSESPRDEPQQKGGLDATYHELERRRMLDDIRRRKKELAKMKAEVQVEVYYPAKKQEQEDEAFALELQEALLVEEDDEEQSAVEDLSTSVEIGEDREDFDPEFEREEPGKNMHDRLESMRQYLAERIGETELMVFYNAVQDNDREDLVDFPYETYYQCMAGLMTEEKVREFSPLIHTLVFLEKESFATR